MPACPPKHHAVSLTWWENSVLGWGIGYMVGNSCLSPAHARSQDTQDRLSLPRLDLQRGFSGEKRLRQGIRVVLASLGVGGLPHPAASSSPRAATAAGRGSEWRTLCAGGQDWAMRPGSGSPEMAARGNPASRPPRPPPPRGSPALHPSPPRPPACPNQPSKQHQVPSPKDTKHPPVRGPMWVIVGWRNPARDWGQFLGSWVAAASHEQAGCSRQPGLWRGRVCLYAWVCACPHAFVVVAGLGSVSLQFGAAPGAPPGLSEPAQGAKEASPSAATAGEITSR